MEQEVLKEKLIQYLEANDLRYIDRGNKISHSCVNPEHIETNPSAFTMLGEEPFNYCSSCGFSLNSEKLYNLLDIGFDSDTLFQSQINSLFKSLDKAKAKDVKKDTPMYLPIHEGNFEKEYRGISAETFRKVGAFSTIPEGYYGKRIIIPIKDIDGKLVSFEAVSTNTKIQPKILRPKMVDTTELLGFEHLIYSDTVFICEGLFSALSLIECGYNGIFNFGVGSIKPKIKKLMLRGIRNIILCGDNDQVGQKFNQESYQALKKVFRVSYFQYPYEFKGVAKFDANDMLKKMSKDKMIDYIDKFLEKNLINCEQG